jgi:hypothetical protein
MWYRRASLLLAASLCLAAAGLAQEANPGGQSNEPNLTEDQKKDFLLNANVVSSKPVKGHSISRLTLSDGTVTHDAAFQPVNEHKALMQFADGKSEINFIDAYRYNIAGYELSRLLGMSDMIPVTVERKWNGQTGALAWWIRWKWDGVMKQQQNLRPPDVDAYNKQMYKVRVFDELIYDTDPNLTNVLITEDWKIWRIDFTRAFRLHKDLKDPGDIVRCDRQLLEKLRQLNGNEVLEKTKPQLTKDEVKALMARRDKIVAIVQQLVAQKGEGAVLY